MSPAELSSSQNPRVRHARKLTRRAFRDKERAFLLEGPVVVAEALRSGAPVTEVFLDPQSEGTPLISELASSTQVRLTPVDDHVMRALSGTSTPQGVVAVCEMTDTPLTALPQGLSLVLVLAGVADPGNAGTLVRSAVAAGADAVVFSHASVDPFGGKTVRASAGLVCRTTIVRDASLDAIKEALTSRGLSMVGADATATSDYDGADLAQPVALVVGNEAGGLPEAGPGFFDLVVRIPMPGPAESLNVGTAGSILLFEAARQRRLLSVHG
jgi:TrmH family RNA methyltransferase